jgi:hypothetical protein
MIMLVYTCVSRAGVRVQGELQLWDIGQGCVVKKVALSRYDRCARVSTISVVSSGTVVCDYDNQLCVVHFPHISLGQKDS